MLLGHLKRNVLVLRAHLQVWSQRSCSLQFYTFSETKVGYAHGEQDIVNVFVQIGFQYYQKIASKYLLEVHDLAKAKTVYGGIGLWWHGEQARKISIDFMFCLSDRKIPGGSTDVR